jgi:hypothetical protein
MPNSGLAPRGFFIVPAMNERRRRFEVLLRRSAHAARSVGDAQR